MMVLRIVKACLSARFIAVLKALSMASPSALSFFRVMMAFLMGTFQKYNARGPCLHYLSALRHPAGERVPAEGAVERLVGY